MLNNLKSPKQNTKKKRIGRGYGSGKGGHTTGSGQKGQKSRSGYSQPRPFFEGGAMPLPRRVPKLKGFTRSRLKSKTKNVVISLDMLNELKDGTAVNQENVRELGLVTSKSKSIEIKVLSKGTISKKITLEGIKVSKTAKIAIEKAGGKVN